MFYLQEMVYKTGTNCSVEVFLQFVFEQFAQYVYSLLHS